MFHRQLFFVDGRISDLVYGIRRKSRLIATASLLSAAAASHVLAQDTKTDLRIGVVTPSRAATPAEISSLRGIRLGAAEATQTARLFGDRVETYEANGDGKTPGAEQAAAFLSSRRKVQILVGVSPADADALATFAEQRGLIFLNVASRSDALRSACRRNTFHIEATDAMYANARRLAVHVTRGNSVGRVSSPGDDSVALWNERLDRFGASQLNDRYRAVTHAGMDGSAWAGWAAIKIASEAALRAGSTDASRIRAYLENATTQFDGHKGWPLSFRATDHQLRQPLYMIGGGSSSAPILDVPDLRSLSSASSDRAAVDALDQLSAGSSARCSAGNAR
jgi:ABC-type branched-subunit amino acid transport system substrate-binding protein